MRDAKLESKFRKYFWNLTSEQQDGFMKDLKQLIRR